MFVVIIMGSKGNRGIKTGNNRCRYTVWGYMIQGMGLRVLEFWNCWVESVNLGGIAVRMLDRNPSGRGVVVLG
jgi:hypothetical protein